MAMTGTKTTTAKSSRASESAASKSAARSTAEVETSGGNGAPKPSGAAETAVSKSEHKTPPAKTVSGKKANTEKEKLFFGRDESWMLFNYRVLEEAEDAENPLLERVKFLAITASNLDEFVEIRVASLLQHIEDGASEPQRPDEGGQTPQQRLERLTVVMHEFVAAQYECWNHKLLPALAEENIRLLGWRELDEKQHEYALHFYENEVDPLLTPVTIDPSHPFPGCSTRRCASHCCCAASAPASRRPSLHRRSAW